MNMTRTSCIHFAKYYLLGISKLIPCWPGGARLMSPLIRGLKCFNEIDSNLKHSRGQLCFAEHLFLTDLRYNRGFR